MRDFLSAIWTPLDGYGELRIIKDGAVAQQFFELPEELQFLPSSARHADMTGWDVYFGVLRRAQPGGTSLDTVTSAPVLWADLDTYKHTGIEHPLLGFAIPASIIVDSGHGIHAYWLLDQAVPYPDARLAMKGIAEAIGGDHTHDAARVLRLPGTHNHKGGGKVPVRLLRLDLTRRYRFSDFADYVEKGGGGLRGTPHHWTVSTPAGYSTAYDDILRDAGRADAGVLPEWLDDLVRNGAPKGRRSEAAFKVVLWLLRYGWSESSIRETFRGNPQGIGAKYHEKGRNADTWFDYTYRAAQLAEKGGQW